MWIKNKNEDTVKLYSPGFMDKPVKFSEDGKARVDKELGKKMIKEYDKITELNREVRADA